jgi:hypothetical protein
VYVASRKDGEIGSTASICLFHMVADERAGVQAQLVPRDTCEMYQRCP